MAHEISANPIVTSTIKIWLQFRRQHGLHRASIQAPILNNHLFFPSCSDPTFQMWAANGLVTINNLYKDGVFSDFSSLSAKYHLPNSHLFRFFQIRHFAQKQFPHFPNRPPESGIDQFLTLDCDQKRLVSTIYGKLASLDLASTTSVKESWEGELGVDISDIKWRDILHLVQTSSICARHSLMQCKVLHRAHFTNAKLARIFPLRGDACNRCKQSPANHTHMFWSCPSLKAFWSSIFNTLEQALNTPIPLNPLTALFGVPPTQNMPTTTQRVIAFTTLLARRAILLKWKHVSPPTHDRWIQDLLQCINLEKIRFSLQGSLTLFHKTWTPLLLLINDLTINPDADEV